MEKLRKAGAVILGKTNLSEWANFRGKNSTSGWSSHGGLTRNPYALDRSACGSSSGSGAGVAANLSPRSRSARRRTARSSVPRRRMGSSASNPRWDSSAAQASSRSRTVRIRLGRWRAPSADAAILLGAMAESMEGTPLRGPSAKRGPADYTPFLDQTGSKGARIGIARTLFGRITRRKDHGVQPRGDEAGGRNPD